MFNTGGVGVGHFNLLMILMNRSNSLFVVYVFSHNDSTRFEAHFSGNLRIQTEILYLNTFLKSLLRPVNKVKIHP